MKCDKLKQVENPIEWGLYYDKNEVDSAIDELKREHHRERHEYIDMVAQLKAEINRKEAVEQRWFERCMEARAENVRLKRALWLARADRAMAESYSVLNDVLTSNRWVKALGKLKTKAEEYK